MADIEVQTTPLATAPATTEDSFVADRQKFWSWFTGSIARAATACVVILLLLAFFLL